MGQLYVAISEVRTIRTAIASLALLSGSVGIAASPAAVHAQQAWPSCSPRSAAEEKILAELEKPTTFDFSESPLPDAMAVIEELHDIRIVLDQTALQEAGLNTPSLMITASFHNLSLRSSLKNALHPLGCDFGVGDDVLIIAPQDSESLREIRCYNVQRILDKGMEHSQIMELVQLMEHPADDDLPQAKLQGPVLVWRDTVSGHRKLSCFLASFYQSLESPDLPLRNLGQMPTVVDSANKKPPANTPPKNNAPFSAP